MNKKVILRVSALLISLLTLFSVLLLPVFAADEGEENGISLTVSSSNATNGEQKIEGSGELHSSEVQSVFNFFVNNSNRQRSIRLTYTYKGEKHELKDRYFSLGCNSEEDYGIVEIEVLDKADGTSLATYKVELIFDGEDGFFVKAFKNFKHDFILNFIEQDRYILLLKGLANTLIITFCALLVGIAIGTVVAAIRSTYDKNFETYKLYKTFGGRMMRLLNSFCKLYLTIIRGTPVVVQLLIMYFIIFSSGTHDLIVAIVAFGINSGAYVAEILRGGIMSVDNGQFEAGRSLGFNYLQTMFYIIIPQMFKSSLPALCNEFISLLKETSIAGYVPIIELTKAGNIIRGSTFTAFMPLIAVALIYLTLVIILTKLVSILERRLRKSER